METKKQVDEYVSKRRAEGFGIFPGTPGHIVYAISAGPAVMKLMEGDYLLVPWIDQKHEKKAKQLLQDHIPPTHKVEILRQSGRVSICARFHATEANWDQEEV